MTGAAAGRSQTAKAVLEAAFNAFSSFIVPALIFLVALPLAIVPLVVGAGVGAIVFAISRFRREGVALVAAAAATWLTGGLLPVLDRERVFYFTECAGIALDCVFPTEVSTPVGAASVFPIWDPIRTAFWRQLEKDHTNVRSMSHERIEADTFLLHSSAERELRQLNRVSPSDSNVALFLTTPLPVYDLTYSYRPNETQRHEFSWGFGFRSTTSVLAWWSPTEGGELGMFSAVGHDHDRQAAWADAAGADLELRALLVGEIANALRYGERSASPYALLRHTAIALNVCRGLLAGNIVSIECPLLLRQRQSSALAEAVLASGKDSPGAQALAWAATQTLLGIDLLAGEYQSNWLREGLFHQEYRAIFDALGWYPDGTLRSDIRMQEPTPEFVQGMRELASERSARRAIDEGARGLRWDAQLARELIPLSDEDIGRRLGTLDRNQVNLLLLSGIPLGDSGEQWIDGFSQAVASGSVDAVFEILAAGLAGSESARRFDRALLPFLSEASPLVREVAEARMARTRSRLAMVRRLTLASSQGLRGVFAGLAREYTLAPGGLACTTSSSNTIVAVFDSIVAENLSTASIPEPPADARWWDCNLRVSMFAEAMVLFSEASEAQDGAQVSDEIKNLMWNRYGPGGSLSQYVAGLMLTHLLFVAGEDDRAQLSDRRLELILEARPAWIVGAEAGLNGATGNAQRAQ